MLVWLRFVSSDRSRLLNSPANPGAGLAARPKAVVLIEVDEARDIGRHQRLGDIDGHRIRAQRMSDQHDMRGVPRR